MQNRTKTVASPVFAALLATLALIDLTGGSVRAADECLAEPKQQTPAGGHWYYRVDRSHHRKCWYVGGEGQRVSAKPARSSPSAEPSQDEATASTPDAISPANANARAELPKELPNEIASMPTPGGSNATAGPSVEPVVELAAAEPSAPTVAPAPSRDQSPVGFSSDAPWLAGSGAPQERRLTVADAETATAPNAQQQQPQQLATPAAAEDNISPWRLAAALLLIALGCVVIIGCIIVRLATAGPVARYGDLSRG